jgi:hypothetical protein
LGKQGNTLLKKQPGQKKIQTITVQKFFITAEKTFIFAIAFYKQIIARTKAKHSLFCVKSITFKDF